MMYMNIYKDYRFDKKLLRELLHKKFIKYKCDAFSFTNSVTGIVGLYIGDDVYSLVNEQEPVDYYGSKEDMAIWKINRTVDSNIQSAFLNTKQIDNPVNETIDKITVIEEAQNVKFESSNYKTYLTRAIIFHCESRDICFEKDMVAFSEEIYITKGYDLINSYPKDNKFFKEDWIGDVECSTNEEIINLE